MRTTRATAAAAASAGSGSEHGSDEGYGSADYGAPPTSPRYTTSPTDQRGEAFVSALQLEGLIVQPNAVRFAGDQEPELPTDALFDKLISFGKAPTDWGAFVLLATHDGVSTTGIQQFFCRESFTLMTVETLVKEQGPDLAHEYVVTAESGDVVEIDGPGVYNLQCQHSQHKLRVRIQDTLGLQNLMPARECQKEGDWVPLGGVPGTVGLDVQVKEHLFGQKLYAVCAVYHVLETLLKYTGESPNVRLQAPSTPHIEYLQSDSKMLELLLTTLPCLVRDGDMLRLQGGLSEENRRLIGQAFWEVKMLVVSYVCTYDMDPQFEELTVMVQFLNTSGFPGTVRGTSYGGGDDDPNEVYTRNDGSKQTLSTLIVGSGNISSSNESWNELKEVSAGLGKLAAEAKATGDTNLSEAPALSIPVTAEMALVFKAAQVDLMTACIMKKLKEPASRALNKSAFEELVAQLDVEFRKPDKPLLKFVQRSVKELDLESGAPEVEALKSEIAALKELIAFSTKHIKAMMKKLTADQLAGTKEGGDGSGENARGAVGLSNVANYCATNALIQVLHSLPELREAVVAGPTLAQVPQPDVGSPRQNAAIEAVCLLKQLFEEMVPRTAGGEGGENVAPTASAAALAAKLYPSEIGRQQDSDELMLKLCDLFGDKLEAVDLELPGRPFRPLTTVFKRLFEGRTTTLQVRSDEAEGAVDDDEEEAARYESFGRTTTMHNTMLKTPQTQPFNSITFTATTKDLTEAISSYCCWSHNEGATDVTWKLEQFSSLPDLLSFSSSAVNRELVFEETLVLDSFCVQQTPEVQHLKYQREKLVQEKLLLEAALKTHAESEKAIKQAAFYNRGLADAGSLIGLSVAFTESMQLRAREASAAVDELSLKIDGLLFPDPSLEEFLDDADGSESSAMACATLQAYGQDSVVKIAPDQLLGTLEDLPNCAAQVARIRSKLDARSAARRTMQYRIHSVLVKTGEAAAGHYYSYVRQADGAFLHCNDATVRELPDLAAVRAEIDGNQRASARTIVYAKVAVAIVPPGPPEEEPPAGLDAAVAARLPADVAVAEEV